VLPVASRYRFTTPCTTSARWRPGGAPPNTASRRAAVHGAAATSGRRVRRAWSGGAGEALPRKAERKPGCGERPPWPVGPSQTVRRTGRCRGRSPSCCRRRQLRHRRRQLPRPLRPCTASRRTRAPTDLGNPGCTEKNAGKKGRLARIVHNRRGPVGPFLEGGFSREPRELPPRVPSGSLDLRLLTRLRLDNSNAFLDIRIVGDLFSGGSTPPPS